MSKQNGKHIPGDWGIQEKHCAVCDHLLQKDTAAPVLEVLLHNGCPQKTLLDRERVILKSVLLDTLRCKIHL